MRDPSLSTLSAAINSYQRSSLAKPFFVAEEDTQSYHTLRNTLGAKGGAEIRLSDFCRENDTEPDFDTLFTKLRGTMGFSVLLGLGEYLALAGRNKTEIQLSRVKDLPLADGAKAVVLLRGCRSILERFCEDPRFADRQVFLPDRIIAPDGFAVETVAPDLGIDGTEWLKAALRELEEGKKSVRIKTELNFPDSIIHVKRISRAYEALEQEWPGLEPCGTAEDWKSLLRNEHPEFLKFLKFKRDGSDNAYLSFIVAKTARFADFEREKIFALLDVPPQDPSFEQFYTERKTLLKKQGLSDADMAEYAAQTKIKGENRIPYLTDNTAVERKGIIESLDGRETIPLDQVAQRYPALADYLRDFVFADTGLTDYFRRYRRQKVTNRIEPDFLDIVRNNATTREYNRLPTRDGVIDLLDKANTALYFVDALGVEFLGFIQAKCAALGLRFSVTIARANLPSLTRINKNFYDCWPGKKSKNRELDKVKHGGADDFDYQPTKLPVHLIRELEIIGEILKRAKVELRSGDSRKAVIAGDHGASRLVVVNGQELKYEVDAKGTHSGRCCAECACDGLVSATVENGWLVLADYGRFKGGRPAEVEVHGGATNEEVLVPVIELTLADAKIEVKPVDSVITANFKTVATLTLFSTSELSGVSLDINGKRYEAEKRDANHWRVTMPDVRKVGVYTAEVFEGANLIGTVRFTVKSGAAIEKDLF